MRLPLLSTGRIRWGGGMHLVETAWVEGRTIGLAEPTRLPDQTVVRLEIDLPGWHVVAGRALVRSKRGAEPKIEFLDLAPDHEERLQTWSEEVSRSLAEGGSGRAATRSALRAGLENARTLRVEGEQVHLSYGGQAALDKDAEALLAGRLELPLGLARRTGCIVLVSTPDAQRFRMPGTGYPDHLVFRLPLALLDLLQAAAKRQRRRSSPYLRRER